MELETRTASDEYHLAGQTRDVLFWREGHAAGE